MSAMYLKWLVVHSSNCEIIYPPVNKQTGNHSIQFTVKQEIRNAATYLKNSSLGEDREEALCVALSNVELSSKYEAFNEENPNVPFNMLSFPDGSVTRSQERVISCLMAHLILFFRIKCLNRANDAKKVC